VSNSGYPFGASGASDYLPPLMKGTTMKSMTVKKALKVAASAAGLVAVLLIPTGCSTAVGGTGGNGGLTVNLPI
jgi:hypothetical protein